MLIQRSKIRRMRTRTARMPMAATVSTPEKKAVSVTNKIAFVGLPVGKEVGDGVGPVGAYDGL